MEVVELVVELVVDDICQNLETALATAYSVITVPKLCTKNVSLAVKASILIQSGIITNADCNVKKTENGDITITVCRSFVTIYKHNR